MLFMVPFIIGAAAGGGTIWFAGEAGTKITKTLLLAGTAYVAWNYRHEIAEAFKS